MDNIFLRNRNNYGAQITCLPFIYTIKDQNPECKIRVIYKENLDYFYKQFNWISQSTQSSTSFSDIKLIAKKESCYILRPNSFTLRLFSFLKSAHPREGIVKSKKGIKSPFLTKQITFDENIYRGIQYLKLHKDKLTQKNISERLRAPFLHEAKNSKLNIIRSKNCCSILIMVGGGAGSFKKWGVSNFLKACDNIALELNIKVSVHALVGPDEAKEKKQILNAIKVGKNITLHENLSISNISKLVSLCDLTIANDCGPSHVAQCIQNGFLGIFDKKKPEWFYQNKLSKCLYPKHKHSISTIKIQDVVSESINIILKKGFKFEDITH